MTHRRTPPWISKFSTFIPRRASSTSKPAPVPPPPSPPPVPVAQRVAGREEGWLRVLESDDLIRLLKAQKAVHQMFLQSRVADPVFRRDFIPAIRRYAEYVQLMPASEAHHHAHAGGLLAHTLEMVLAAMTWRNAHFLPTNAPVEQIDAERDQWTYVVFYAALLHDIAKPMTDLRILWRGGAMDEPLRWKPLAGSLFEVGQGRLELEYRVEFEPKASRDYQAHNRLALTLLHQIAPKSALTFLSQTPHAFDALTHYLSGHKDGLLADIIKRADQASTSNALMKGSKARFATANAVPLVDLLMQALKSMLQSGTELPLNRTGAAGWVYDGSVWFVAKRLADATRAWIKKHEPDESVPGEAKNDRLFDTWQEYGILQVSPHSGQAIWHVEINGQTPATEEGAEAHQYRHRLSVLRFPLSKLYDDPNLYPPAMSGEIHVRAKRGDDEFETETVPGVDGTEHSADTTATHATADPEHIDEGALTQKVVTTPKTASACPQTAAPKRNLVPAMEFRKPKNASTGAAKRQTPKNGATQSGNQPKPVPTSSNTHQTASIQVYDDETVILPAELAVDGFDVDDDFLDEADTASNIIHRSPPQTSHKPTPVNSAPTATVSSARPGKKPHQHEATAIAAAKAKSVEAASVEHAPRALPALPTPKVPVLEPEPAPKAQAKSQRMFSQANTTPVVLTPSLPELPHEAPVKEPSEAAMAFIQWLQQGLASREIKYNESGAPVHFVEEGMALISPKIFKLYAAQTGPEEQADAMGMQIQREVIKAGWHRMRQVEGGGKVNILRYQIIGKGNVPVASLAAVVLTDPDRFVLPVPPVNPVLKLDR